MRFFLIAACLVGTLVISMLGVVDHQHRSVSLGYDIGRATQEQRQLEEELERLRIDRAALLDPARVEPIAIAWGLRMPGPDEVVLVQPALAAVRPSVDVHNGGSGGASH